MAKSYYAVAVGRTPGLYKKWDDALKQINGIRNYDHKKGYLATNSLGQAIAFLKNTPLLKVTIAYSAGIPMAFEELSIADHPSEKFSNRPVINVIDRSRISKEPICEAVNQYCSKYGYSHLSTDQRRAVQAVDGKYLLFAVPGSGKTTVLLARTGYMIHACHIPAHQIMSMTFTKAAAKEMHDRYAAKFPNATDDKVPEFRTIHSFCMRYVIPRLREAGYPCPRHVIDEGKAKDTENTSEQSRQYSHISIFKKVFKDNKLSKSPDEVAVNAVQAAISCIKNNQMHPSEYANSNIVIDKNLYLVSGFFESYAIRLKELDCMDYDDMLLIALKGLKEHSEILRELRNRFTYWSVDEAQDNSVVQHELLSLLAGENGNLFMVGDDDQSIYSFRGSKPQRLLDFGNRPDVTPMIMDTNYRSSRSIVAASKLFIEANQCRADKEMKASHSEEGCIRIPDSFRSEADQYQYIIDAAKVATPDQTLGVLYQLNASALPLVVYLHRAGISFEVSKGVKELLNAGKIGLLLNIMQFSRESTNWKTFEKIYECLNLRFLSKNNRLQSLHAKHKAHPDQSILALIEQVLSPEEEHYDFHLEEIQNGITLLKSIANLSPAQSVNALINSGLNSFKFDTLNDRLSLMGLLTVCDLYETIPEMQDDLNKMIQSEKEKHSFDENEPSNEETSFTIGEKPSVTLTTIHSSKGRQWDRVMLIDLFNEVFPGMPQPDKLGFDAEEPRRVFYVAATRAISVLEILTVNMYHGCAIPSSSFIGDYAFCADQEADTPVEYYAASVRNTVNSTECVLRPSTFYGVRIGRKPGVYTDYSTAFAQTNGYSGAGSPIKFNTYEDAWEYAFPGTPVKNPECGLSCNLIRKYIQLSEGATFNYPIELPKPIRQSLMQYLGVETISALSREKTQYFIN